MGRSLNFANVASGWFPHAPERTLNPEQGPCWRDLINFRWHEGGLEFRNAVRELTGTVTQPPAYPEISRIEVPLYIFQTTVGRYNAVSGYEEPELITLVVTTTDVYYHSASLGWQIRTPFYQTGSISASTGVVTITGVGTQWLTRKIVPGNFIRVGAEHLQVVSVTGDLSLTVTPAPSGNYSGSYYIYRTFNPHMVAGASEAFASRYEIYASLFNGDLYVAGSSLHAKDSPMVLRFDDAFGGSPALTPLGFGVNGLFAKEDLTGSMDTLSELAGIRGLLVLPTGQVVIGSIEEDAVTAGRRVARLRHSAFDQSVWTDPASAGGWTEVVSGGIGDIMALGNLSQGTYTVHFRDGVAVAQLTGQDDAPLSLLRTAASVGCAAPRTLKSVKGGEMYMSAQGDIHFFNGSSSSLVSNMARDITRDWQIQRRHFEPFAVVDPHHNEYQVFFGLGDNPILHSKMDSVVIDLERFTARYEVYPVYVFCACDEYLGTPGQSGSPVASGSFSEASRLIGVARAAGVTTELMLRLVESYGEDDTGISVFNFDGAIAATAISDILPLGPPGALAVISAVFVKLEKPVQSLSALTSETIEVAFSEDGGQTYAAGMTKTANVSYPASGRVVTAKFTDFTEKSAEGWRMRIRSNSTTSLIGKIKRIRIRYEIVGDEEAVT